MTTGAATYHVGPDGQPDEYRLLQQVGGGGEAQLWQADLAVAGGHEPVAVKVRRAERTGEFARFSQRWAEQADPAAGNGRRGCLLGHGVGSAVPRQLMENS